MAAQGCFFVARRAILLSASIAVLMSPNALFATGNGTAICTINPSEARSAGARWRLDIDYAPYTNWLDSGSSITISNITTQGRIIEFKDVTNWSRPFFQGVTFVENKTTNITVSYQSQSNMVWTKQWGSNAVLPSLQVADVAVDGTGYAYVMGYTYGSFDGRSAAGGSDIFVTKWSPSGTRVWTRIFGSPVDEGYEVSGEITGGIALDSTGGIYVASSTKGFFDGVIGLSTSLGASDCCLVKLTSSGDIEWVKIWGSTNTVFGGDYATAVTVEGTNVYVCGYTIGSFHGQTHPDQTQYDMFLTKRHSDGGREWTRIWDVSNVTEKAYAVAVDSAGNVIVAGTSPLGGYAENAGPRLTKFNSSGTQQWTTLWAYGLYASELGDGTPQGLVVDGSGNIYVSGYCDGAWSNYFDGIALPSSLEALFLTKWSSVGTKFWTQVWGSAGEDRGGHIARGSDGRLYVAGLTYKVSNYGDADAFMTVWNTNDTILLTHIWGSTNSSNDDKAYAVAVTPTGDVYVAGNTDGSMDGNPPNLNNFITKWQFPCPPPFGSVSCSISPSAAVSAGAQWKLTSGPDTGWKNSETSITNIPVGSYSLAFSDLSGWTKPPTTTVSVAAGQTTTTNGTYTSEGGASIGGIIVYGGQQTGLVRVAASTTNLQNRALSLDGDADGVVVASPSDVLKLSSNHAMCAWIKMSEPESGTRCVLLGRYNSGGTIQYEYNLYPVTGQLAVEVGNGNRHQSTPRTWMTGVWYHVAFTYGDGVGKWYVNGVLDSITTNQPITRFDIGSLYIGRPDTTSTTVTAWSGLLDEISLWTNTLLQTEIVYYKGRELSGTESSLVGYWSFDDGTPADGTPNGNDGAFVSDACTAYAVLPNYSDSGVLLTSPTAYTITNLPASQNYCVYAFRDSNGNGSWDSWEGFGAWVGNPLFLTNDTTGVDIQLTDPDSDKDGIPDYRELVEGTNPNMSDTDDDGFTDLEESIAGTNPTNRTDYFKMQDMTGNGELLSGQRILWNSKTGRLYRLNASENLQSWSNVYQVPGSGEVQCYTNDSGETPFRGFQLRVEPQ